jgi:signal transduction histidine kinase
MDNPSGQENTEEMEQHSDVDDALLILDLSREVTSSLRMQDVLDRSLTGLRKLVDFGGGAIQLLEDDELIIGATDPPAPPEHRSVRVPIGTGVAGTIAATGEPVYIPDITDPDAELPGGGFKAVSPGVVSYFGWPLIMHGKPMGVVQIDSPERDAFSSEVRRRVLSFAPIVAAAVQNAVLFQHERNAVDQLRVAERLKREFLNLISHELRTPLAAVLGFTETIHSRAGELTPDMLRNLSEGALRAGRKLDGLIQQLLELSDIEAGILELDLQPTDLGPVLKRIVRGRSGHRFAIEVPADLPPVVIDVARFEQVITTLLDNAQKFSDEGTDIDISATADGDEVLVTIADRGKGIAPEQIPHIFEPFFQLEESLTRVVGGLGIGLHLAQGIAFLMNGRIAVESELGAGSRFTLHLPVAKTSGE